MVNVQLLYQDSKSTNQDSEILYKYFADIVKTQPPKQVVSEFECLFMKAKGHDDLIEALSSFINSKASQQSFDLLLNHCCHILIDTWSQDPTNYHGIYRLAFLFNEASNAQINPSPPGFSSQLQELFKGYAQSKSCLKIRRLGRLIYPDKIPDHISPPLANLLCRYPFLYKHCLMSQDSGSEYRKMIRHLKNERKQAFEVALIQYLTYRKRLVQIARARQLTEGAGRIIKRCNNPTFLSDADLYLVIKKFKNQPKIITSDILQVASFGDFKEKFYDYLVCDLEYFHNVKVDLIELLYQKLMSIYPESEGQKLSEFLLLYVCSQIIKFLLTESDSQKNPYSLSDLINHLGTTQLVNLLLKVVVLCPKVKPRLEQRLSLLFERYESLSINETSWLIKILEHLLLAYSIYLGKMDLSVLNLL